MRPGPLTYVVGTLIACLAGGCVTVGQGKPTAKTTPADSQELADQNSSKSNANKAQADKSKSDSSKTVAGKKKKVPPADNSKDGSAAKTAEKGTVARSATTMALIQSELRDATPAEREQMLKSLEGEPDERVPKLLSIRRTALQQQREDGLAKAPDASPDRAAINQAGASSAAGDSQNSPNLPIQSGLGSRTPWNQGKSAADGNAPASAADGSSSDFDTTQAPAIRDKAAADARALALGFTANLPANPATADALAAATLATAIPLAVAQSGGGSQSAGVPNFDGAPRVGGASAPAFSGNQSAAYVPANSPVQGNPIQLGQPVYAVDRPAQGGAGGQQQFDSSFSNGSPNVPSLGNSTGANMSPQVPQGGFGTMANGPNALANGSGPLPKFSSAAVNQAVFAQSSSSPEDLQKLIATTESSVAALSPGTTEAEKQRYIERHVYLRMLYLMAGRQDRALQYIPGLEPADQEFWQQMFWGMFNYFDSNEIPNSADRATQTVRQLNQAILKLKEKANLELRNVTLCHKITNFGDYERFPRDEFAPGQRVLLYAELANFRSDQAADGRYRTMLTSTLEVRKAGAQGELVEKIPYAATEDLCRNYRRDYFHNYAFNIPKIVPGAYVLKLTVEDQLSQRSAISSLNFTVK